MATGYIGQISMFGGTFAPRTWAFCSGQILSIAQNTALFSILGTTYGGNGQTTFALPDLRGRLPMHAGQGSGLSSRSLGEVAGAETVTLLITEIPLHSHTTAYGSASVATSPNPIGRVPANVAAGTPYADAEGAAMAAPAGGGAGNTGGGQPHNNMMPYQCVSFIIATQGIFPARN